MRVLINLGLVAVLCSSLASCGKSEAPVATIKSRGFSCDLQSSGAASNDASNKAFQCAYNSLKSAGKLAAGGLVTDVANIIDGVKQVYEGSYAAGELYTDLNEFISSGGKLPIDFAKDSQKAFDTAKGEFEKTDFGKDLSRRAMYRCLDGSYKSVKDLLSLGGMASTLSRNTQGSGTLKFSDLQALSSLSFSGIKSILDRMNTLSECTQWLNGSRTRGLIQLSKGVKQIASSLDIVSTVARCGVDLARGGYVLYSNSACLVEDIQNYYNTREREEKAKVDYINNPKGGFQPLSEKDATDSSYSRCMNIYGMWLAKQSFAGYFTRSSVCSDLCASANGQKTYYENSRKIFTREDDYGYCLMKQKIPGSRSQVESCISYCCSQEGGCVKAANQKVGFR